MSTYDKTFITNNEEETVNIGSMVVSLFENEADTLVILLSGDLGAGKTRIAQGAAKHIGVREFVSSPTFIILNEYTSGSLPFYHFDIYRLSDFDDMYDLGFTEYIFEPCVMVIEWSERIPDLKSIISGINSKAAIVNVDITRQDVTHPDTRTIHISKF